MLVDLVFGRGTKCTLNPFVLSIINVWLRGGGGVGPTSYECRLTSDKDVFKHAQKKLDRIPPKFSRF